MFCEHASFVPTIEAKKIEEALRDADWMSHPVLRTKPDIHYI
jgi:hypothetical protein